MFGKNTLFGWLIMVSFFLSACVAPRSAVVVQAPDPTLQAIANATAVPESFGLPKCPGRLRQEFAPDIFDLAKNYCPGELMGFGVGDSFEYGVHDSDRLNQKLSMTDVYTMAAWFNDHVGAGVNMPVQFPLGDTFVTPLYVLGIDFNARTIGMFIPDNKMAGIDHKIEISEKHGVTDPVVRLALGGKVGYLNYFEPGSCTAVSLGDKTATVTFVGTYEDTAFFNRQAIALGDPIFAESKDGQKTPQPVGYLIAMRGNEVVAIRTNSEFLECGA